MTGKRKVTTKNITIYDGIYHSRKASASMQTAKIMKNNPSISLS